MKSTRRILIVIFICIACSFFYKTLTGKLPVPSDSLVGLYHPWRDFYAGSYPRGMPFKNFLITDPVRQIIPWRKIAISQWKQGSAPGWNPYAFSGTSLRGNIQAAPFYPLNIFFFLFPFDIAWTLLIVTQPLLAGVFMYIFLSSRKLHPLACLTGAVSWSFSGVYIAWLTWGTIGHTLVWLPLMLLATDRMIERPGREKTWGMFLALLWTMSFLAGHVQIFLYCFAATGGYFVRRLVLTEEKKYRIATIVTFVLSVLVFVILSALQWVPMLPGIEESSRIVSANWQKEGWFLPWEHLVQFIAPDFFGNPATLNYWGKWNYGEFIGYIGVIQIFFVLYAVLNVFRKYVSVLLPTGILLIFLLPNPVAAFPYMISLPVLSALQPTRLLGIVVFLFVLFSSFGVHVWLEKKGKESATSVILLSGIFVALWVVVLGAGRVTSDGQLLANLAVARRNLILPTAVWGLSLALIVAAWRIGKKTVVRGIVVLLLCITVVDLFRFGWKFTPFTDRSLFFPQTKVLEFLSSQPKPFRVMTMDDRILPPNTSAYYGIESIEGYDPIYSSRYETFMAAAAHGSADVTKPFGFDRIITLRRLDPAMLKLLNVRYVLSFTDLPPDQFSLILTEGETKVYEFMQWLPRAFFVQRTVQENRNPAMLARLFTQGFSPELIAYHIEPLPGITPGNENDTVRIREYADNRMTIETHTEGQRLLFVSIPQNSAWKVFIDGEKSRMYRIDYMFPGIVVPAGTHTIELKVI